jgi:hypothetical protein
VPVCVYLFTFFIPCAFSFVYFRVRHRCDFRVRHFVDMSSSVTSVYFCRQFVTWIVGQFVFRILCGESCLLCALVIP